MEALAVFVEEDWINTSCLQQIYSEIIESNVDVVDVNFKQHWAKNRVLGDTTSNKSSFRGNVITFYFLSVAVSIDDPLVCFAVNTHTHLTSYSSL